MKKLFILAITCCLSGVLVSQNRSINFEKGDWNAIKEKAGQESKLIFVDAYTTWCGPCKMMAKQVFTNDEVADYFNKTFINAKIDMEKGEGIELAKKYRVEVYPSFLFIDGKGKLIHRSCGFQKPDIFIQLGKDAINPEKQFHVFEEKYQKGNRDKSFMNQYLMLIASSGMDYSKEMKEYFETQKESELTDGYNWSLIFNLVSDLESREFQYLLKNKEKFYTFYSKDSVKMKINSVLQNYLYSPLYSDNPAKNYPIAKKKIEDMKIEEAQDLFYSSDLEFYASQKDLENYKKVVDPCANKIYKDNPDALNNFAWFVFENYSDKEMLEKALIWAKRSIEMKETEQVLDTYANLLFKLGRKEEAVKTQQKAIEIIKNSGGDTTEYEKTLKKFKEEK